jgi:hypothetical protein
VTIVSGGYGQPKRGSLVAFGLTLSEPAAPGDELEAALSGSGALTATLTDANATQPQPTSGGIARPRRRGPVIQPLPVVAPLPRQPEPIRIPAYMTARIAGTGAMTATAGAFDWIAYEDDELLLMLGVMA